MNEAENKPTTTVERTPKPVWRQLFKTTEGRILLLGIAIALAGAYITIAGWSYLLFDLYTTGAALASWAPILIIGFIILAAYHFNLLGKGQQLKKSE